MLKESEHEKEGWRREINEPKEKKDLETVVKMLIRSSTDSNRAQPWVISEKMTVLCKESCIRPTLPLRWSSSALCAICFLVHLAWLSFFFPTLHLQF